MRERTLASVAVEGGLVGGPFGSNLVSKDYEESGVPVIRGTNMGDAWVGGEFAFVSPAKFDEDLSRNSALPGDVVFTQRGTLGQVARVPAEPYGTYVVSQSQMRLRVDESLADAAFVYYACSTPRFLNQVRERAISTGVPHINLGILSKLRIPDLPRGEQAAIGRVLSATDDKITANRRTLEVCVDLADAHFARLASTSSRSLTIYGEAAVVLGGGTPKTTEINLWGGPIRWATPTDVTRLEAPYLTSTTRTLTSAGLTACASQLHPAGSVLMTSRATIGAFALAQEPMAVNQGFIVVNAVEPDLQWWLYHDMRSRVEEFVSHANGATFLELSRGRFKKLPVAVPHVGVARKFRALVLPMHSLASKLMQENEALTASRDELLTLLMSRRVRVGDLPDAMPYAGVQSL